ncbi:protein GPR107 isoform X2 [Aethina tumida]|uniref:protein GPR107 isoform X2 n=1 Tax=Aethina tumida TaxID=116153 RepID=UPI00096B6830|nr:protein GPR107 isoform X2 [Aethina tumida]
MKISLVFIVLFTLIAIVFSRKHRLEIYSDGRRYIPLSTFGFYQGGYLDVQLINFHATPEDPKALFGFSLDRTKISAVDEYLNKNQDHCVLVDKLDSNKNAVITLFLLDLQNNTLKVKCNDEGVVHIYKRPDERKTHTCKDLTFDIASEIRDGHTYYNASFYMAVENIQEEGLYNLYFHNCPSYNSGTDTTVDCVVQITEKNTSSFLSAGEMPLPALYCMMSVLFFLSGMFWVFLLRQSKHPVFKLHWMMTVLVFLKALSLAFHGVNYHYIESLGVHLATWAILFYVAHLLKGALLFVIIVLVGTGWTFIKHVLTDRDKRVFMAVIPLQVLANIAEIILEESEEGSREYTAWRDIVVLIDLLCCGCILFPVVWSIRHLQVASQTDGKAALNLRKLKLFRHFYIMIVCYIYTTRIIVSILKLTVTFQYEWLHEMFREMATYVFFVLTAYKFRPASQNPYFALNNDDDDVEEVLTESGATEGLNKVNNRVTKVPLQSTMTEVTEEEKDALLSQRESSHDYD